MYLTDKQPFNSFVDHWQTFQTIKPYIVMDLTADKYKERPEFRHLKLFIDSYSFDARWINELDSSVGQDLGEPVQVSQLRIDPSQLQISNLWMGTGHNQKHIAAQLAPRGDAAEQVAAWGQPAVTGQSAGWRLQAADIPCYIVLILC